MKLDEFEGFCGELMEKRRATMQNKRHDYTVANEDVLFNFKETARLLGIHPLQALWVHCFKQVTALITNARYRVLTDESADSRDIDIQNYIDLDYALRRDPEVINWDKPMPGNIDLMIQNAQRSIAKARNAGFSRQYIDLIAIVKNPQHLLVGEPPMTVEIPRSMTEMCNDPNVPYVDGFVNRFSEDYHAPNS